MSYMISNGREFICDLGWFSSDFLNQRPMVYTKLSEVLSNQKLYSTYSDSMIVEMTDCEFLRRTKTFATAPALLFVNKEMIRCTPIAMIKFGLPPVIEIIKLDCGKFVPDNLLLQGEI